jgi:cyclopropane fatty-acyl-phospholipid synthase-like methyltransferase
MNPSGLTVIQQRVLDCVPSLNLPARAHVLDAPCGGTAALTLALQKSGFSAVGADVDLEAADRLGSSFKQANLDASLQRCVRVRAFSPADFLAAIAGP